MCTSNMLKAFFVYDGCGVNIYSRKAESFEYNETADPAVYSGWLCSLGQISIQLFNKRLTHIWAEDHHLIVSVPIKTIGGREVYFAYLTSNSDTEKIDKLPSISDELFSQIAPNIEVYWEYDQPEVAEKVESVFLKHELTRSILLDELAPLLKAVSFFAPNFSQALIKTMKRGLQNI